MSMSDRDKISAHSFAKRISVGVCGNESASMTSASGLIGGRPFLSTFDDDGRTGILKIS